MAEGDAENPLFASPMQLLRPDAKHHFLEPVPETMEALARVDCPVNIITGVGTQRLGKSTILNMFHSRKCSGFGLGHSLDAQTTGLWIWLRRHPKDPSIVVALMDTEGLALRPLDTPHISQSYNWTLSSLALLISNVFMYQTKSSIDSSATERLGTILAVAEQLRGKSDPMAGDSKPTFLWVLRDMQLQMTRDPKEVMMGTGDPKEVMMEKLEDVLSTGDPKEVMMEKLEDVLSTGDPKEVMMEKLEDGHLRKLKKFFRLSMSL
ncbi:guanylate-binding protein [Baffinella frigidus]|nr:guanylate-binding protein [Cryptophyta sp. CCMP2293]